MSSVVEKDEAPSGDAAGSSRGSGKSSKLDSLLEKLQSGPGTDHSRENSPEPSASLKDTSQACSSRRRSRKPAVIRKVVESEDEASQSFMADMDEPMSPVIEYENTPAQDTHDTANVEPETNGDAKPMETIDIDEHGNLILPEGTVLVEPEDVEKEEDDFIGPEFRSSRKRSAGENDIISCSACNKQINQNVTGAVRRHPVLKVLICKRCYNWYTSDEIEQDQDGCDDQCRWCGEGGDLLCCDYCHNAFCKPCIKRNLGRTELANILQQDENVKWRCYVCNPKPLAALVQYCNKVMKSVEEANKRRQEKDKRDSRRDSSVGKDPRPGPSSAKNKPSSHASARNSQRRSHNLDPMVVKSGSHSSVGNCGITINPDNVQQILKKLLAATHSMNTVVESLRDDITGRNRNGPSSNRNKAEIEVSKKLTRAYLGFKQSLEDIESFSRSPIIAPRPVGRAIKHGSAVPKPRVVEASRVPQNMVLTSKDGKQRPLLEVVGGTIIGINPRLKEKANKPPVVVEEVIELSDSSDDFEPVKVKKPSNKGLQEENEKKHKEQPDEKSKSPPEIKSKNKDVSKANLTPSSGTSKEKKSFSRSGKSNSGSKCPDDSEKYSVSSEDDTDGKTSSPKDSSDKQISAENDQHVNNDSLNDEENSPDSVEKKGETEESFRKDKIFTSEDDVKKEGDSEPMECDQEGKKKKVPTATLR